MKIKIKKEQIEQIIKALKDSEDELLKTKNKTEHILNALEIISNVKSLLFFIKAEQEFLRSRK